MVTVTNYRQVTYLLIPLFFPGHLRLVGGSTPNDDLATSVLAVDKESCIIELKFTFNSDSLRWKRNVLPFLPLKRGKILFHI